MNPDDASEQCHVCLTWNLSAKLDDAKACPGCVADPIGGAKRGARLARMGVTVAPPPEPWVPIPAPERTGLWAAIRRFFHDLRSFLAACTGL